MRTVLLASETEREGTCDPLPKAALGAQVPTPRVCAT